MTKKLLPILFALLFVGCSSSDDNSMNKKNTDKNISNATPTSKTIEKREDNSKEALFTIKTVTGKTLHIDEKDAGLDIHEFRGKVVFLIFFGHQCPPCMAEIPELIKITKEGHKDLEIMGLEVQGLDEDRLEKFVKYKNINYNIISGEGNRDFIGYVAQKAGWSGAIPFLLAMDKNGVVQVVHAGGLNKAQFDNIYKELKAEKIVEKKQ